MSDPQDPSTGDSPAWAPLSGPAPSPWTPAPPAPYGSPPAATSPSAAPPSGYYAPDGGQSGWDPSAQQGWGGPQQWGPPGEVRGTGRCILLAIVTLGIYTYIYNYKVHREMKAHSGRGIGGGIALLLSFVAGVAMPFVTPSEVGGLYARRGEEQPVNGWTGLWLLVPAFGGYLLFFVVAIAAAEALGGSEGETAAVVFGVAAIVLVLAAIAGAVVWFVKTNGALNRYWASVGAR